MVCRRSCSRQYRILQRALWPAQESSTTSHRYCILVSTVAGRRHLRSADTMKLSVQRTRTVISTRDQRPRCSGLPSTTGQDRGGTWRRSWQAWTVFAAIWEASGGCTVPVWCSRTFICRSQRALKRKIAAELLLCWWLTFPKSSMIPQLFHSPAALNYFLSGREWKLTTNTTVKFCQSHVALLATSLCFSKTAHLRTALARETIQLLEWPLTRVSRSLYNYKSNISKTVRRRDTVTIGQ